MEPTTQVLVLADPKKHSIRYNAKPNEDPHAPLSAIYVSRLALPRDPPNEIEVTIKGVGESG